MACSVVRTVACAHCGLEGQFVQSGHQQDRTIFNSSDYVRLCKQLDLPDFSCPEFRQATLRALAVFDLTKFILVRSGASFASAEIGLP